MCEVVNQLDFLYKVSSDVPHLLTQIVLCEGAVCRKPETDVLIARGIPVRQHALLHYPVLAHDMLALACVQMHEDCKCHVGNLSTAPGKECNAT